MGIRSINFVKRKFAYGNVSVCGLRGRGKDLLTANVVVRRNRPYVSNVNYGGMWYPLDFSAIDCGGNTYNDFVSGNVKHYEYPYPKGTDVYISDAGVILPSQYCNELNKKYPYLATFCALTRHVGRSNIHFNVQNLNRMYDKIREMSDIYINCNRCIYLPFGIVLQKITVYDKYQSCVERCKPCRIHVPLFNRIARMQAKTYIDNFENVHGFIKSYWLIYRNKSNYDTHHFEKMLKEGTKCENT